MEVLINNIDLEDVLGITVYDYTGALNFAAERENERVWADKSGVDRNLANIKYEAREFILNCYCKEKNEVIAYNTVKWLVDYMFSKGVFVLSLRETGSTTRECFLCERSSTIVSSINIREQNSLYVFKLGLKDVNPNALTYKTTIVGGQASILYDKGQTAVIYWGNGGGGIVSNSGIYTKSDYTQDGVVDVIVDIDKNAPTVEPLEADFTEDARTAPKPATINFIDNSLGTPTIWSWDFGDGGTSSLQNPSHTYTQTGTYTVTLQVFNAAGGVDTITKSAWITVTDSGGLWNDTDYGLWNNTDYGLIN